MAVKNNIIENYKSQDDIALVQKALEGDNLAFNELFSRYEQPLKNMLAKRGAAQISGDIVQESFIKAFINLDKYNPIYEFRQWIYTIAIRLHIDHTRKSKKETLPIDSISTPSSAPNPEQSIIEHQLSTQIKNTIDKLPKIYKEVIELRFLDELSYEEITCKLNIPLGTVKTHIHRAKAMLMEIQSLNNYDFNTEK